MDSGVFSYVKIHLHVQRNKLLSETIANNVKKSNLIKQLFLKILKIERDKRKLWAKSVKNIFNDEVKVRLQ